LRSVLVARQTCLSWLYKSDRGVGLCVMKGMHEYAEFGHAAHWLYKEGDTAVKAMEVFTESLLSPSAGSESSSVNDDDEESENSRYGREYQRVPRTAERVPPRAAQIAHPALRIEDGRLLAAVIVRLVIKFL
jgi:hypothetical protein